MFQVGDIIEPTDPSTRHMTRRLILEITRLSNEYYYTYLCLVKGRYGYSYLTDEQEDLNEKGLGWIKIA